MSAISFIIESLICSGLFLVLYRWMLAKKVSFRLCRIYLIVTMLLSVTIPVMEVPVYPSEQIEAFSEWTVFSFDDLNASVSFSTSGLPASKNAPGILYAKPLGSIAD